MPKQKSSKKGSVTSEPYPTSKKNTEKQSSIDQEDENTTHINEDGQNQLEPARTNEDGWPKPMRVRRSRFR